MENYIAHVTRARYIYILTHASDRSNKPFAIPRCIIVHFNVCNNSVTNKKYSMAANVLLTKEITLPELSILE